MSHATAHETTPRRVSTPSPAPGTTWFAAMVALWSVFVTLLAVSPETLDDVWDWLGALPLVLEIVMWILLLPWALGYLVAESSWAQWVQVLVLALLVAAHLGISVPREKR